MGTLLLPPPEGFRYVEPDTPLEGTLLNEGEEGWGDLSSDHTDGRAPEGMRGKLDAVDLDKINEEFVLRSLYKEANDFGTRTRQGHRVRALELLGKKLGMFAEIVEHRNPVLDSLMSLPPHERKERIMRLSAQLIDDPDFVASVEARRVSR